MKEVLLEFLWTDWISLSEIMKVQGALFPVGGTGGEEVRKLCGNQGYA